jgi:hypothetical protein
MTMNVNSRKPWTPADVYDLRQALGRGTPIDQVADFLSRDVSEVRAKASQLGLLGTGGHGGRRPHPDAARTNVRHAYAAKGPRPRKRTGRGSA